MATELRTGIDVLVARRLAGLKQWQLAARLGISQTTLCEIERDRRPITPEMARRIADALAVPA